MSSLVTAPERSVAGKITRSGLDTRRSRPPASTIVASDAAMPRSSTATSPDAHQRPPGSCSVRHGEPRSRARQTDGLTGSPAEISRRPWASCCAPRGRGRCGRPLSVAGPTYGIATCLLGADSETLAFTSRTAADRTLAPTNNGRRYAIRRALATAQDRAVGVAEPEPGDAGGCPCGHRLAKDLCLRRVVMEIGPDALRLTVSMAGAPVRTECSRLENAVEKRGMVIIRR